MTVPLKQEVFVETLIILSSLLLEQERLLGNDDQLCPKLLDVEQFDVDVVDMDLSALDLSQSEQAVEQAGLARPRPSHHSDLLGRLGLERDSLESRGNSPAW